MVYGLLGGFFAFLPPYSVAQIRVYGGLMDSTTPPTQGMKFDQNKPCPELLPPVALMEISKVLAYGKVKYAPNNWRHVRGWRWRYTGALLRHVFAYMTGEKLDPESGLLHLSHAGCCLLFLLELEYLATPHGDDEPAKVT